MAGIIGMMAAGTTFLLSTILSPLSRNPLKSMKSTFSKYDSPSSAFLVEIGNEIYEKKKDKDEGKKLINNYTKLINENINNLINNLDFNDEKSIKDYFNYDLLSKDIEKLLLNQTINLKNFYLLNDEDSKTIKRKNHINYLVIGNAGIGKTTLINSILKLSDKEKGKTESNRKKEIKKVFTPYNNKKYLSWLTLYDSERFEKERDNNLDIQQFNDFIEGKKKNGNYNEFIHGIWYCIDENEFSDIEVKNLIKLYQIYSAENFNIIVVHLKGKDPKSKIVLNKIKDYLEENLKIRDILYISVEAIESEFMIDQYNKIKVPIFGLKDLINLTKNSIPKTFYSLYLTIIQKILENKFNQEFENTKNDSNIEFENIENTLLNTFKESLKKIITNESINYINSLDYNKIKYDLKLIEIEAKNNNTVKLINQFISEFKDDENRFTNKDLIDKLKLSLDKHIFFKLNKCFENLLKTIFQNFIFKNLDSKINHSQIYKIIENNIQN